jgi:hypothetical protein
MLGVFLNRKPDEWRYVKNGAEIRDALWKKIPELNWTYRLAGCTLYIRALCIHRHLKY